MLAILATHPIQYQVPIWRRLAERGRVPFEVWYLSAHGVRPSFDLEFGKKFQWDLDLLGGYPARFPSKHVPQKLGGFWKVGLGSEYRSLLTSGAINAVLVPGWSVRACWEATYWAHKAGVPVWIRGDSNDLKVDTGAKRLLKRSLLDALFSMVSRFLYVGEANKRLYQKYGIDSQRLVNGAHCVDNARFKMQAQMHAGERDLIRRGWGISRDAFCILYVGKFIPQKRPLDLVMAIRHLARRNSPRAYHLLFVGSGQLGAEIRRNCRITYDAEAGVTTAVESVGDAPCASFTGFMNQTEISRAYVVADALVLPSGSETWGLVVNEGMASGVPCIVSDACGSAEDLAVPIDSRLSYRCGDVEALASAIGHLSDHPVPASAIAERISHYDVDVMVEAVEMLWAEIAPKCQ